jgi:hypothetical protein
MGGGGKMCDDLDSDPYDTFLGNCPNWCECIIDNRVELTVNIIVKDASASERIINTLVKRWGMVVQGAVPFLCLSN